jgi:DNA-binding NarL/FixJ family response regulator
MQPIITVFVADDHQIFRQGLIKLLESERSIAIVGESGDGAEALQMIQELRPDVAILDISMPNKNGLDIVKQLKQNNLATKCVILTMYNEEEYFNEALDCGVKGYLLKDNAISDLLKCVKCVVQGKYYVSPLISEHLLHRDDKIRQLKCEHPGLDKLTTMEKRILKLIAENKTSKEIAEQLFISPRTVENHRSHICEKLGLKGHHKLLLFALEQKKYL